MKIFILFVVILAIVVATIEDPEPPNYNYSFKIAYDEYYTISDQTYKITGQTLYDPVRNRERVDRSNGNYNDFCGSILPNVSTPCISLTKENKRYYYYPEKSLCCFCCDSDNGCGILKPDWLWNADYLGVEALAGGSYDKWNKDGFGYNYFWATRDEFQIPRRLDQGGLPLTDYIVNTFQNTTFPDSVFALPPYCNEKSVQNCPMQSICGELRKKNLKLQ